MVSSVVQVGVEEECLFCLRLGFAYGLSLPYEGFRAVFCSLLSVTLSGVVALFLYLGT